MAKRQYTVTVTQEQLRRFSQYEILFEQLIGTKVLDFEEDVLLRGNAYPMTMEDVAQMVENVRRKKDFVGSFLIGWLYPLHYDNGTGLQSLLGLLPSGKKAEDCTEYVLPVTERSYVRSVLRELVMDLFDFEEDDNETPLAEVFPFDAVEEWLTDFRENLGKPYEMWKFPASGMRRFILAAQEDMCRKPQSERDVYLFRKFTDELAAADDETALQVKGYQAYEGTAAYPQDFRVSWDMLSHAFELSGDPGLANTLGYDCYYGRLSGGVPEYEKALKYFTYGAAAGITESVYKLADLFAGGHGIRKNRQSAARLVQSVYDDTKKEFCDGAFTNPFADVALRMGKIYEEGWFGVKDEEAAFGYYLEADYAIRRRMHLQSFFGDAKVAAGIRDGLERLRKKLSPGWDHRLQKAKKVRLTVSLINHVFSDNRLFLMKIVASNTATCCIKLACVRDQSEDEWAQFLLTIPDLDYCELIYTVMISTVKPSGPIDRFPDDWSYVTSCVLERENDSDGVRLIFYDRTSRVIEIPCREYPKLFLYRHNGGDTKVYRMAGVKFSRQGQIYDYLCDDPNVNVGDTVIVLTKEGEQKVRVARIYESRGRDLLLPMHAYKSVLRKVENGGQNA